MGRDGIEPSTSGLKDLKDAPAPLYGSEPHTRTRSKSLIPTLMTQLLYASRGVPKRGCELVSALNLHRGSSEFRVLYLLVGAAGEGSLHGFNTGTRALV